MTELQEERLIQAVERIASALEKVTSLTFKVASSGVRPTPAGDASLFDEVFGAGGMFERVFGKRK